MDKREKMKGKIEALIRKANDSATTPEESATFMMQANRLLVKYNLEMDDLEIELKEDKVEHDFFYFNDEYGWNKTNGDWMFSIFNMVAPLNLCYVVRETGKRRLVDDEGNPRLNNKGNDYMYQKVMGVTVIGLPINIEMTKYMATSMINQLKSFHKKAWKEYDGYEKRNTFYRGYFRGAINTLYIMFHDFVEDELQQLGENLTALMRTNEIENRRYAKEDLGMNITKVRRSSLKGISGAERGAVDARNVRVNKGLESSGMSKTGRMRLNQ